MIQYPPIIADTVPAFVMGKLINEKWRRQIYNWEEKTFSSESYDFFKITNKNIDKELLNMPLEIDELRLGPDSTSTYEGVVIKGVHYSFPYYVRQGENDSLAKLYGVFVKDGTGYGIYIFDIRYEGEVIINFYPNPAVNFSQIQKL